MQVLFLSCHAVKRKILQKHILHPRLRILSGTAIAFGPGKADLLQALAETGSITNAAAKLGMSYMRAWTLIRTMNRCFCEPLVISARGGMKGGGGACLTETGSKVLALYRKMEDRCRSATQSDWQKFEKLLKRGSAPTK